MELSEQRKSDKQIKFRVSEMEYQQLEANASALGMSVPAFCKNVALKGFVKSPKINREGALEIAKQLRKIGTNVNQISYKTNIGKIPTSKELIAVKKELGEIWLMLNSALQSQQTD